MSTLSHKEKKQFRTIGHELHPVVTVAGNGVSPGVLDELHRALRDHELIKVRIQGEDKAERVALLEEVTKATNSQLVQLTGGIALIVRRAQKPNKNLSNLVRFS